MTFLANILNPVNASSFFFGPNASGDATIGGSFGTTFAQVGVQMPIGCTFDSIIVTPTAIASGFGSGGDITVTLYVDNVATALLATGQSGEGSSGISVLTGSNANGIRVARLQTIAIQASGGGLTTGQGTVGVALHCTASSPPV
jgi:hypothetical protein